MTTLSFSIRFPGQMLFHQGSSPLRGEIQQVVIIRGRRHENQGQIKDKSLEASEKDCYNALGFAFRQGSSLVFLPVQNVWKLWKSRRLTGVRHGKR